MTLMKGKLQLTKKGKPQVQYTSKKGKPVVGNVPNGELSASLMSRLQEMRGKEVEFELVEGQPKKVREVGGRFKPPGTLPLKAGKGHHADPKKAPRDFHNPYNFIPAPPRYTDHAELGDQRSVSQDQFHPGRYTGRIRVRMKAVTPLLVVDPETESVSEDDHKTYDVLKDSDGKPLIPASSIRGMLRSAYEAVTNSRFGRFDEKHRRRLAFRMEAREGLNLIPARVQDGKIHLLTGTSQVGLGGKPVGPQYAAWLPRYSGRSKTTQRALCYPDKSLPRHGDEVECWVELVQHHRWDKRQGGHVPDFQYWRVVRIVRADGEHGDLGPKPEPSPVPDRQDGRSWHQSVGRIKRIQGWVCITNANIGRKHDERVFFLANSNNPPGLFDITDEYKKKWRELIRNYQEIHEDDLAQRRRQNRRPDEYLDRDPGKTAWSRHVYRKKDLELKDGTICYVRLYHNRTDVEALFPVMISRELYEVSPWDLLDASLRPAQTVRQLSPADRVFGWVSMERGGSGGDRRGAVRGLLRVGPVECLTPKGDAIEELGGDGLPLAILAQPKPQQGRFYVAKNVQGEAQDDGLDKRRAGYAYGKGLRGRKVYPHHAGLSQGHWDNPMEDRTQHGNGPWQEYRRPKKDGQEQRDSQNRSIKGWIKPGTEFSFDIHVLNLSKVELGALLWLLTLPENHYHRFGGGKPLGFGSVRLTLEELAVHDGDGLRRKYASWNPPKASSNEHVLQDAVEAFKRAVSEVDSSGGRFEDVKFIKAFQRACEGFPDEKPIHYPRATANGQPGPPSADGESFKWFVRNEREHQYALRNLQDDSGLPTLQGS